MHGITSAAVEDGKGKVALPVLASHSEKRSHGSRANIAVNTNTLTGNIPPDRQGG